MDGVTVMVVVAAAVVVVVMVAAAAAVAAVVMVAMVVVVVTSGQHKHTRKGSVCGMRGACTPQTHPIVRTFTITKDGQKYQKRAISGHGRRTCMCRADYVLGRFLSRIMGYINRITTPDGHAAIV